MKLALYLSISIAFAAPGFAQHHEHDHDHEEEEAKPVTTQIPIQTGSGTSWMPGTTPPYMLMYQVGEKQHVMLHSNIALRYLLFDSPRAENSFSAPNWIVSSLDNRLSDHDFLSLRVMLSLDRITE